MSQPISTLYKQWILMLFVLFSACSLNAQWSLGFKGGFNMSFNNLTFDENLSDIKSRGNLAGLTLAIPIEYPSGKMLSFQSGLVYTQKGTRFNYQEAGAGQIYNTKYIIDYIELPLIGKLGLEIKPFRLYVLAGTQLGYALNMRAVRLSADPLLPNRQTIPLDFELAGVSRFDIGLLLGGGVEANISKGRRIFVEMQYNTGIKDIDKQATADVHNESRMFTMGIMLPLPFKKSYSQDFE